MSIVTLKTKSELRARRHRRVRAKVKGTAERPRMAVFRSNRALYVQIIDDTKGATLASADSRKMTKKNMKEQAAALGEAIAESAKKKGITAVVFDRGGFTFTGRVQALADSARAHGLIF